MLFQSKPRPPLLSQLSQPDLCCFCGEKVYMVERHTAEGVYFHRGCFRCHYCNSSLRLGAYAFQRTADDLRKFHVFYLLLELSVTVLCSVSL